MKKLIVVLNDLETSGKTTVARTLAHHLSEQEVSHLFITTDERDMDDYFQGDYWDFEDELELSQLIHSLDRHNAVILDVSSGEARSWADFCEAEELDTVLAEMDVEMTLVIPEHPSERCHNEIVDLAELFSDQADYVIAHLPMEARRSEEAKWKGSYAAKGSNYLGALEMTLPGIEDDLSTAMESAGLSLSNAMNRLENLPRFLEVQVTQWLEKGSESANSANEYLIPETSEVLAGDY